MGSFVDGRTGRAAPALKKFFDHLSLTAWVLSSRRVSRLWLQAVVGRWVFDFQHRRPCFGALEAVWSVLPGFHGWRPMPKHVGYDFLMCCGLVPLMFCDMRAQFDRTVYCTDASEHGAGACRSKGLTAFGLEEGVLFGKLPAGTVDEDRVAHALVLELLRRADHKGTDVRLDLGTPFRSKAWPREEVSPKRWHWQEILSFRWATLGSHINEYELHALFSLVRWLARGAGNVNRRFCVLLDSMVVLSVAAKGRSSSKRLNHILRRLNAHLLACSMFPFFGYVSSQANPADKPSRCFSRLGGVSVGNEQRRPSDGSA